MKVFLCAAVALSWTHHALAKTCSELRRYQPLNGTTIENAELTQLSSSADGIAYCRVSGSVAYGERDNSVRFELWLPEQKFYNNRFMVVGKLLHGFHLIHFPRWLIRLMTRQWRVCGNN
jgi:hypothetical protein